MASPAYLIFDLDGTISNPAVGILRSINYALTRFSYPEVAASEISTYIGPPIDFTFRSLTRSASEEHILALVGKFRERYADVGYAENSLYPGIIEALDQLCARGVRLGVCTAKRADLAEKVLNLFGVRGYFEFVCGGDVGITKSDQLSGLLTDRTVGASSFMVGDRAVDVVAAKRNALHSVGVLWGHGSRDELVGAGADQLLSNTAELNGLADSLQSRLTSI